MKAGQLLKYMDFMMNQLENMEIQMFGNISQMFLTIYHLLHSLKEKYFIIINIRYFLYMEDYPQVLILWIVLDN